MLTTFYNLFTDLNENLKQHIQFFQSDVDSSESALMKSDYLKDIESDVKDHYDDLLFEWERAGEIINNVSDISSAIKLSFYDVNVAKNEVVDRLTDLEENLDTFTSKEKAELSEMEHILDNIERTINDARTVSGSARFTDYMVNGTDAEYRC